MKTSRSATRGCSIRPARTPRSSRTISFWDSREPTSSTSARGWRTNYYVSDKWQATRMLTLSLGIRYDYQHEVPLTKNAYSPRLGVALAPNERTLFRAGAGKFYQYQSTAIPANLFAGAVNSPVFTFDTGQDNNPTAGRLPTRDVCLLPVNNGGQAEISPACRAQLVARRAAVAAVGEPNTEPVLDG